MKVVDKDIQEIPIKTDIKVRPRMFKSFEQYVDDRLENYNYGQFQIAKELWEEIQYLKQDLASANEMLY